MEQNKNQELEHCKFFSNTKCEFFPCHEVKDPSKFNCMFCYCPLYTLGDKCGGNYKYLDNGIKDCSGCMVPHQRHSYDYITSRYGDLAELAKKNRSQE